MTGKLTRKRIAVDVVLNGASFGGGGDAKTIEGLACDVSVSKCGLPSKNSCVIAVNNLRQSDVERITTLSPVKLSMERNLVRVRAWAEGDSPAAVFAGEIVFACGVYSGPDLGVRIEAQTGAYPSLVASRPFTFDGAVDWRRIVEDAVSEMDGYAFENRGVPALALRDPALNGSPLEKIMEVARQLDFQVICDDMRIIALPWEEGCGDAVRVGADTGMIGYPELNPNGIRLRHEYRPHFRQGGVVRVESLAPGASGDWKILKLGHRLQSCGAGEAWDTVMEGIRI